MIHLFDIVEFAKNLKSNRENLKLTQVELAKKAGVASQTISAYESTDLDAQKRKAPTLDKAIALANVLGVSLDELCGERKSSKLENYADLVDYLNMLGKYFTCIVKSQRLPLEVPPDCSGHDENGHPILEHMTQGVVLEIHSEYLAKYMEDRDKMLKLVRDTTIDPENYAMWKSGKKKELEQHSLADETYGHQWQRKLIKENNEPLIPESWRWTDE